MKLTHLTTITVSTVVVIISGGASFLQSSQAVPKLPLFQSSSSVMIAAKTTLTMGNFVTVEQQKATTGKVKIVAENGQRYLELDSEFSTANGPDVEIILYRNSQVPAQIAPENYVTLAKLKSFNGSQRYLIPDKINLDDFQSVAIWCRQFNVTFGYASLN